MLPPEPAPHTGFESLPALDSAGLSDAESEAEESFWTHASNVWPVPSSSATSLASHDDRGIDAEDEDEDDDDDDDVYILVEEQISGNPPGSLNNGARYGEMFVEHDKAWSHDNVSTKESLDFVIQRVRKPQETYDAVMAICAITHDLIEEIEDKDAVFDHIRSTVLRAVEWLLDVHDDECQAMFALIGQLIRVSIFDIEIVGILVERYSDTAHLVGRMRVLHALFLYAGEGICAPHNIDKIQESVERLRCAVERLCDSDAASADVEDGVHEFILQQIESLVKMYERQQVVENVYVADENADVDTMELVEYLNSLNI